MTRPPTVELRSVPAGEENRALRRDWDTRRVAPGASRERGVPVQEAVRP